MPIPARGLPPDAILTTLAAYKQHDLPWRSGRALAYIYDPGQEARDLLARAYTLFLIENALDPTSFPSILRLETEVVRIVAELLRAPETAAGNFTSGGTESILLAVKAARDYARAMRPGLAEPEMVLPRTAHAAFHKAAAYLGVRPVVVEFDPATFRADPAEVAAAITDRTILLVASAPCYSHGVIDPIHELGELALERGLLLHVDACVGGIQLSFMRRDGVPLPDFDFSVPGVTSISADLHKYGYAAKGASVILYRDRELRKYQLFASSATTGYTVINPTVQSSRSGGPVAAAWALLHFLGEEGYRRINRAVMDATRRLIAGVNATDGLRVLGEPAMSMFAFTSDTLDLLRLADVMKRRGWYIQPQLRAGRSPLNLHVSVTHATVPHVDAFLAALRTSAAEVAVAGPGPGETDMARLLADLAALPPAETYAGIAAVAGLEGGALPDEMSPVNAVLNALSPDLRDALLLEFINGLYA